MTVREDAGLSPERRRSAALRATRQANFSDLVASFKTFRDETAEAVMLETFDIAAGSPENRRAQADQIAQEMGAATEWYNGYYMATATISGQPIEVHFNPPIFASDMPGGE